MAEHYAREAHEGRAQKVERSLREQARALWAFANVLYYGKPFFDDVFFGPMRMVDPSGTRLREAYRRIQLLHDREIIAERPFVRFMTTIRKLWDDPRTRFVLGPLLQRIAGVDPDVMGTVYRDDDLARTRSMSFEQLAEEAVAAKYAS